MIRPLLRLYRDAFRGLPRDVWLLSFVALVNRSGSMVLPFISLYLTQDRGLTISGAGRVLALYGLGAIAGSYIGGWLSDRIGATRAQAASLLASGAGFLGFLLLDSAVEVAVGAFVLSVLVESFRPAVMTDMARRAPAELQPRAFALLRLAVNLGLAVGPAAAGFLALVGYRWLFIFDALTCWLAAVLLRTILGFTPPAPHGGRAAGSATKARSPWRDGPFLLLMLFMVCLASVFFQIFSTLPLYFRQVYGFREDAIGLLLALNAVLIVAFEMVLIHRLERLARLPWIGLGAFLVCTGLALMPHGSSVPWVAFTIAVWTLGEMLALPLVNAVVADRAGGARHGRYMGLYTMSFSIAFGFGPVCGTWIYEHFGPDTLWHGIGVLGVVLGLGAVALIRAFRSVPA